MGSLSKKIFFDARWIRTDFHDGVSRYTTELANAIARLVPVTFLINDMDQLKFLPKNAEFIVIHANTSPKEPFTALILNRYSPDVVYSPMQTMGSFGRKFKLILTLHDMIYYKHRKPPTHLSLPLQLVWRLYHLSYFPQRMVLSGADIVATVSETSKKEILETRLTKQPVIVVSNAARDLSELLDSPIEQGAEPPKNLVYMGAFLPYKNAETLIKAMAHLPGRSLHLLSKIKPEREAELQKLVPTGADVVFHHGVSDEEYAALLAQSAIMVSASKAEGFGLPLSEALMLGVPAVVSDKDFFHEVGDGGAVYANPDDPRDFAGKIMSLDDKKRREELVKKGRRHIRSFSWDHSAKVLFDAIKDL
jgi:glycosyltransferase involved in cell wall biosynthesis